MTTLLLLAVLAGALVVLGRAAVPAGERLPWRDRRPADWAADLARGVRILLQPSPRQRHLVELQLAELAPRRRPRRPQPR
jgi:hypothetical protein